MRRTVLVRAVALVATCAGFLNLSAYAAPLSPRLTLAGTTVVTGSRSAWVAVRLPRAVEFSVDDVTVWSPRGRMTSVVLKKDGPWSAPQVEATHPGFCAEPGCPSPFPRLSNDAVWAPGTSDTRMRGRLPAGNYRLYLVADGAPTSATFRFRGLTGSVRITPTTPARGHVVTAPATVAHPAAAPVAFAGGGAHLTGRGGGVNHVTVWKEVPFLGPPSAVGLCIYQGTPRDDVAAKPYQMPCPGGSGGFPPFFAGVHWTGQSITPIGPGRFVTGIDGGWLLPPGAWAVGGYNNTPGPVTAAYVHQLWLDF